MGRETPPSVPWGAGMPMTDNPPLPKVPTGRLKHPDIALLEGYLDRLQEQLQGVQQELAQLKATDGRQTHDLEVFQEQLSGLHRDFDTVRGKIEAMVEDQQATRASQARTEASLVPIHSDLTALKRHVSRAAGILAILDLLVKLLLTYHTGH